MLDKFSAKSLSQIRGHKRMVLGNRFHPYWEGYTFLLSFARPQNHDCHKSGMHRTYGFFLKEVLPASSPTFSNKSILLCKESLENTFGCVVIVLLFSFWFPFIHRAWKLTQWDLIFWNLRKMFPMKYYIVFCKLCSSEVNYRLLHNIS